jgi:glycosyltransferase involved in cell wall biosynthesis
MKIAFCAIVKGSDDEAPLLDTLLSSVEKHVDGLFITITQPNEKVRAIAQKHNATISEFEWVGDFAKARNFNFAQVPKEYDYIMWGDADDTFDGMEHLRPSMEQVRADAYLLWYVYDHDKYGLPTVVHAKTMLIKNDGSFTWKGRIHEDIDAEREIEIYLIQDVKRIHHPTEDRVRQSAERNLGISLTEDEEDPRTWWNRSNALLGMGENEDALEALNTFVKVSQSDAEKYLAYIRMGHIAKNAGDLKQAVQMARNAIAIHYDFPDAYFALGEFLVDQRKFIEARDAIMEGLKKKPPVYSMVVYNPRDYDYNPLMLLAKCYWDMGRPSDALVCLRSCKEIQPKNKSLDAMIDVAQEEADLLIVAKKAKEKLASYKRTASAKKMLASLPEKVRQHPIIMHWANQTFIKETSSGKDVVYFCGMSHEEWNPDSIKTGIGGSEEAVILLTQEWAKLGYNVTVYTNCGPEKTYNGVLWRPWYLYNPRDRQDITILWRIPKVVDYDINSEKVYVDLHDTVRAGEFTEERLGKIDKIFVKSKAHRRLFPKIPDEKFAIITNPIDDTLFQGEVERDSNLIINTSSPERSLEAVCRVFGKLKKVRPDARLKYAYGWTGFDAMRKEDADSMKWKKTIQKYMEALGIEDLGRISHTEVAKLYKQAKVFFYPTKFLEIDCISARKAQIAGANVVASTYGALNETIEIGTKIPVETDYKKWNKKHAIEFGDTEENDELYVQALLTALDTPNQHLTSSRFTPEATAKRWVDIWDQS